MLEVGVGITIAHDPLHGSGRADFPHPALALGNDAHAPQRIGMTNRRAGQPASEEAPHAVPQNAAVLTAPRESAMPEPTDSEPEKRQRRLVHGHSVVADVSTHHRLQSFALLGDHADMRKAQKVERLRFPGKTTLVNILGKFVARDDRILLIEDTAEIHLAQPNLVRFEARQAQNGLPAVAIRDLLKAALRHRPDRIILGEIRGGEAFDLLQLLNTGHSGTLSTIHANSAKQGLARFTSCVLQSGVELPYRAIKTNIADSLNVVVQLERRPGRRYISEVLEINGYDPDADLFDYGAIFLAKQDER